MHLIDTSAWIDYFKPSGDPGVRQRVGKILEQNQACWCEMILLELQSSPGSSQSAAISALESVVVLISIDHACWSYACELSRKSKKQGKPVPNTDILIYATACIHQSSLVHNDKHFDWLDDLTGKHIAKR
jgi:predicted nucleic acid-binding protein